LEQREGADEAEGRSEMIDAKRLAMEMAARLRRCEELQAAFESLTPDERAEFDELCNEECAEFDWVGIRNRIQDGSMSAEQADRWLDKLARAMKN
jgi:hypothetical protein